MLSKIAKAVLNFLFGKDPEKDERAILIQQKVGMVMWRASGIMLFLWVILYKRVARFEEWSIYCFIALMALTKFLANLYYNREI